MFRGVDLDVAAEVTCAVGWSPIAELTEQIRIGEAAVGPHWPMRYAACGVDGFAAQRRLNELRAIPNGRRALVISGTREPVLAPPLRFVTH